jgi:large subunit ribosomal protein L21
VYAVVQAGGKQHKVSVGQTLLVELMHDVAEGQSVELDDVLAVGDDDSTLIGRPNVAGARVVATVVAPDQKGEKLIVFKYKPKVRYRRRKGHRQHYTRLQVTDIVSGSDVGRRVGKAVGKAAGKVLEVAADAVEKATEALPGGETSTEEESK